MADRSLVVHVIGDDRSFQQALNRSTRSVKQFQAEVGRAGALNQGARGFLSGAGSRSSLLFGSGAFLGTAGATALMRKAVDQAVSLNEEVSKSRQIFGESSAAVESWAQTTARSIGVSRAEALKATGTFGNLFRVVDLAPEKSAEMSRALVQLAADIASFNNATPEDVLLAIRSGLIGEAEPLRRYGVLLSEARVQQIALANTGKDNVKALTDQEKALARYQIIMQDTITAQGDFARTSDGLANQQRTLRANLNDLAGNIGAVLIPVLTDAARTANALFIALDRLGDVDINIPGTGKGDDGTSIGDIALAIHNTVGWGAVAKLAERAAAESRPETRLDTGPQRSAGRRVAERLANEEQELQRAKKNAERLQKRFRELILGLQLKLDVTRLEGGDEVAVLREMERAILRRIQAEGRTFALVEQLTGVRLQIASALESRALEAAQRASDAWNETMDALSLNLEVAQASKSLQNDLVALRAIEDAILRRIQAEGRTTALLRDLFRNRQEQAELRRQMAQNARDRRQEDQFEALGLTAEGQERAPSAESLKKRTASLQDRIKGTILDTSKTRSQLQRIANLLKGDTSKIGREVRQAIQRMLDTIAGGFDQKAGGQSVKTGFVKRGIDDLLAGLGLSPEEEKALRQRFAAMGAGGTAPSRGLGAFGMAFKTPTTTTGSTVPQPLELHVYIDGEEVETRITKRQQKKRGRTAPSRRGLRPGI